MKPPIFWSRLGSSADIATSVIGENPTEVGTLTYDAVYFGNGARISDAKYFILTSTTLDQIRSAGTVEFWAKHFTAPAAGSYVRGFNDQYAAVNYFVLYWGDVGTMQGWYYNGIALNWDQVINNDDIVHYACVWDKAGIDGGAHTRRVYVNGGLVASTTSAILDIDATATAIWWGSDPESGGHASDTAYDNLKIYNYAKSNFDTRVVERGGMDDLVAAI